MTDLVAALTALREGGLAAAGCPVGDGRILLVAGRDLPFERLLRVVDQGHQVGFAGFDLLVDDPTPGVEVRSAPPGVLRSVTVARGGVEVDGQPVGPDGLRAALGDEPVDAIIVGDEDVLTGNVLQVHNVLVGIGGRAAWGISADAERRTGAADTPATSPASAAPWNGALAVLPLDIPNAAAMDRFAPPPAPPDGP